MPQHNVEAPHFGAWITLDSAIAVEQIAQLGFDHIVVDGQHGLLGYPEIRDALVAITAGGDATPFVRVSANDSAEIGRALDAGATGIIVPLIDNAADAQRAAAAARYPVSGGRRSYSPIRHGAHFGTTPAATDAGVTVLAMIETPEGLEHAEAILEVEGIDGIFVGPYDLSLGLGATVPFEAEILPALEQALSTLQTLAAQRNKIAGIYAGDSTDAIKRAQQGFTFINTATDITLLRDGMAAQLHAARSDWAMRQDTLTRI